MSDKIKLNVELKNGESRAWPGVGVCYGICKITTKNDEVIELYEECEPDLTDGEIKIQVAKSIIKQAKKHGIKPDGIIFN